MRNGSCLLILVFLFFFVFSIARLSFSLSLILPSSTLFAHLFLSLASLSCLSVFLISLFSLSLSLTSFHASLLHPYPASLYSSRLLFSCIFLYFPSYSFLFFFSPACFSTVSCIAVSYCTISNVSTLPVPRFALFPFISITSSPPSLNTDRRVYVECSSGCDILFLDLLLLSCPDVKYSIIFSARRCKHGSCIKY